MTELEALRRVAEAAREWRNAQHATEQYEAFRKLCAALDALPAPAAAAGEVVEVRVAVWVHQLTQTHALMKAEHDTSPNSFDPHWQKAATIRARVPLPRLPEVVGEVDG